VINRASTVGIVWSRLIDFQLHVGGQVLDVRAAEPSEFGVRSSVWSWPAGLGIATFQGPAVA